jgi:hypothetical protein
MFIHIMATHNGFGTTDATTGVFAEVRRIRTASVSESGQVSPSVVLVGTGTAQVMELRVDCTNALWTTATVYRMAARGVGI